MANIQAAMPAKFLQVAGEGKSIAKMGGAEKAGITASLQLTSFLGVLKSQLSKPDVLPNALPEGLPGIRSEMPVKLASEALLKGGGEEQLTEKLSADSKDDTDASEAVAPLMTAAVASVLTVSTNMVSPMSEAELPQKTESDASAVQQSEISSLTTLAGTKSEAAIKADASGEAAIAAESRQALPQGKAAKALDSSEIMNVPGLQTSRDVLDTNDATSASGLRLDTSATTPATSLNGSTSAAASLAATTSLATPTVATSNTPMMQAHPFDQSLRQADARINAAIETPVRSPAFAAELGDKVVWLASRQGQFAELSLNPPQMGALEVRLSLSGSGEASAQFFSPNPIVRETIDAALPKLRELMAQAGINLGEAEVREHAFGQREQSDLRGQNAAQEAEIPLHQAVMAGIAGARSAGVGLVDLYI